MNLFTPTERRKIKLRLGIIAARRRIRKAEQEYETALDNWRHFIKQVVSEAAEDTPTTMTLTIVLTPDPFNGGYVGECKEEPAAISQGESKRGALINTLDALVTCLG
ncbi:MAG: hypothetical protein V3W19_15025, partial [Desulfatiglandales bacterium]